MPQKTKKKPTGKKPGTIRLNLRDKIKKRIEKKRLEQQMGGNYLKLGQMELFKPAAGYAFFDIIPYQVKDNPFADVQPGEYWYERTFYIHGGIGVDQKSYLCPKSFNKPCPICQYRAKLIKQAKTDADWEMIKALKPRERQLYLVYDVKAKEYKVFEASYFLFGKKLEEEIREGDEDWGNFAELDGGFTLRVRFTEKKLGQFSFLEATRFDFLPRKHKVQLQDVSLDDLLNLVPEEQLAKVFFEGMPDDTETDEFEYDEDEPVIEEDESGMDYGAEEPVEEAEDEPPFDEEEPEESEDPDFEDEFGDLEDF